MVSARLRRVMALTLAVAVVAFLVAYVGPRSVLTTLRDANPLYIFLAFAAYALFFVARGFRWQRLLQDRAPNITVGDAANLTAMGWLVSTFVPMKAGDVTRSAIVAYRSQRNVASIVGTVAVERALDVVGLALASTVGLVGLAAGAHRLLPDATRGVLLAWLLPPLGLLVFMVFARTLARRPQKNVVVRYAALFLEAADELRRSPRQIPALVLWTLASTTCQVVVFTLLFLGLAPNAPVGVVAAGVPLFLLSFIVSVTPGNVGTYEAAFAGIYFALLGWPPETLLSMAVTVHLLTITTVTILGGGAFILDRLGRVEPQPAPAAAEAKA
ncbi:MAG TPA: lysylphosphatidylglycerol synthase transmembrane domain-containing protein [Candidatus Thermoplasmatota archaeon]|nr:lysylphosphatidylglycerol synthase transmembrane domain-containing protein [Candidatus Thermoplasmatota archaeon]